MAYNGGNNDKSIVTKVPEAINEEVKIYSKKLITDNSTEIIESKYDWSSFLKKNGSNTLNINPELNKKASQIHSILIP